MPAKKIDPNKMYRVTLKSGARIGRHLLAGVVQLRGDVLQTLKAEQADKIAAYEIA